MSVRAKFRCTTITNFEKVGSPGEVSSKQFTFSAAYGKGNEQWSKYTPQGELRMTIDNPHAWMFEIGREYYLDFADIDLLPARA